MTKRTGKAAGAKRYRVLVNLTWPADRKVQVRLYAGEGVPWAERGSLRTANKGEVVDDLPPEGIDALLRSGKIEEVG